MPISDLNQPGAPDTLSAKVCVVGGGAVGIALAVALARAGVDVLLLEGGGPTLETRSQALHKGQSVGHPFPNIEVGRYRVLGGTTAYWGGQVVPFDDFVTGDRPWAGHAAWPIDTAELRRCHDRAYGLLGLEEAEFDDRKVWEQAGNRMDALGPKIDVVMTRWMKTRNFSKVFAKDLQSANGPRVVTHANVTAIRLDAARGAVDSLTVRSLEGRQATVKAEQFVLANGSLEIARLLMHPLADGSAAPWSDSKWLGAPLIDHLDCMAADVEITDHKRFQALFDSIYYRGFRYYPKVRLSPAVQRAEGLVDISAQFRYRTRFSEHLDVLKMFLRSLKEGGLPQSMSETDRWADKLHKEAPQKVSYLSLPRHVAAVAATSVPLAVRYFKDRRSFKPRDAEVSLAFFCEQLPSTQSRVSLGDDVDELGMRRIRVNWHIDGRELQTMRSFALVLKQEFEERGLAKVKIDPRLLALDREAFVPEIFDAVHQMGTTRIGRDAGDGFVDPNLAVHGIANLHLAGACTFPSTGFANPTFTAVALALRLSDRLAGLAR